MSLNREMGLISPVPRNQSASVLDNERRCIIEYDLCMTDLRKAIYNIASAENKIGKKDPNQRVLNTLISKALKFEAKLGGQKKKLELWSAATRASMYRDLRGMPDEKRASTKRGVSNMISTFHKILNVDRAEDEEILASVERELNNLKIVPKPGAAFINVIQINAYKQARDELLQVFKILIHVREVIVALENLTK